MYKWFAGLFFYCLLLSLSSSAQLLPKEDSKLNYRLIGFMFPYADKGAKYTVEIAAGNYNDEDSFKKNIVAAYTSDTNRLIGEVPHFGARYTWRSIATAKTAVKSGFHHFSTITGRDVDTGITRLRILKPAEQYKDAYVFMDGARALYDMDGKPVWFLPAIDGISAEHYDMVADFKLTPFGTITYITNRQGGQIYEVNYSGDVLWKGPNTGKVSGDSIEHYHHEFTRLKNGHYMTLGSERVLWKLPGAVDNTFMNNPANRDKIIKDSVTNTYYERQEFGIVIEYDRDGNVVWQWRSKDYFKNADIFNRTQDNGTFFRKDVHQNAFVFDEDRKCVYVSFKNVSRIVKLKYPDGDVLNVYGRKFDKGGIKGYGPDQFSFQHNIGITAGNDLYLFNNNSRRQGALPTLLIMKQPAPGADTLTTIWEYACTTEGRDLSVSSVDFSALGSVAELPDGSLFACMSSSAYTKAFIVSKDKRILWSAMPERWNSDKKKWLPIVQYRAGIIVDKTALAQLIWNMQ